MSEAISDVDPHAGQTNWFGKALSDIHRQQEETRRWCDEQSRIVEAAQERAARRVLGFIPGDVWDRLPMLVLCSVCGSVAGIGFSTS